MQEALQLDGLEPRQDTHRFDTKREMRLSARDLSRIRNSELFGLIRSLRSAVGDAELIRLLNLHSAEVGRQTGERHAHDAPDTSFQTCVGTFRPPNNANSLTHRVVEDTERTFALEVTECWWADVFREAGRDGEIGHAAVCNMDYHWPGAFNPSFRMERTRTLMRGHGQCDHRYIQST